MNYVKCFSIFIREVICKRPIDKLGIIQNAQRVRKNLQ